MRSLVDDVARFRHVTPDVAAVHVLRAVFGPGVSRNGEWRGTAELPVEADDLGLTDFQRLAADRALAQLHRFGGVIVADAVGLGKTFIALALIRDALQSGQSVCLVVPSMLRAHWAAHLRRIRADVRGRVHVLSHAQLSRGGYPASLVDRDGLLLVDEAHAFRNVCTRRRASLLRLASTRRVCLITATPVNNSVWDLYHLIRLWAANDSYGVAGVPDMRAVFSDAAQSGTSSPDLMRLLREAVIRRTRADVQPVSMRATCGAVHFPVLDAPAAIHADPDDASVGTQTRVLDDIMRLSLSTTGGSSAALIRFLLLKRLASSPAAFIATVRRLMAFHREYVAALDEGLLLRPADVQADHSGDDRAQLTLRRLTLRPVPPDTDVDALRTVALDDHCTLQRMWTSCHPADAARDAKLRALRRLIMDTLRGEKVIVFSEFRETATYLWRSLSHAGGIGLVHGGGGYLGAHRATKAAVINRFAPLANNRRNVHRREDVRILIATDVLSEGLNLQDCAHVVSYDLPWNPVRLIQRVGRIDRLGSSHGVIHAYNFVPDGLLERYLAILTRLQNKLNAIDVSVGADRSVLATGVDAEADIRIHARGRLRAASAARSQPAPDQLLGNDDEKLRNWLRHRAPSEHRCGPVVCTIACSHEMPAGRIDVALFHAGCVRAYSVFIGGDGTVVEVDPLVIANVLINARPAGASADFTTSVGRALGSIRNYISFAAGRPETSGTLDFARSLEASLSLLPGGPTLSQTIEAEALLERRTALGIVAVVMSVDEAGAGSFCG